MSNLAAPITSRAQMARVVTLAEALAIPGDVVGVLHARGLFAPGIEDWISGYTDQAPVLVVDYLRRLKQEAVPCS